MRLPQGNPHPSPPSAPPTKKTTTMVQQLSKEWPPSPREHQHAVDWTNCFSPHHPPPIVQSVWLAARPPSSRATSVAAPVTPATTPRQPTPRPSTLARFAGPRSTGNSQSSPPNSLPPPSTTPFTVASSTSPSSTSSSPKMRWSPSPPQGGGGGGGGGAALFTVRVPQNKAENRELKAGLVEEDNAHLAYLNVRLVEIWIGCAVFAVVCVIFAILSSLYVDYVPSSEQLARGFIVFYGNTRFICNSTLGLPVNGLPSLLNLFEVNVPGNVFFRCAVCLPMVVRVFHAMVVRNVMRLNSTSRRGIYRACCDALPYLAAVECFALAIFSVVTLHNDFPEVNRLCKTLFFVAASVHMLLLTVVTFGHTRESDDFWDNLSMSAKFLTATVFCYLAPQYLQYHQSLIAQPLCHSLLPRLHAYQEYVIAVAYCIFHLTGLADVREVRFICYPRASSGECEPLEPSNFGKGARFEHARAYELRQRQVAGLAAPGKTTGAVYMHRF